MSEVQHCGGQRILVFEIISFLDCVIQTDGEKIHPSQKPIALIQRIITDASVPGDLVVDPFAGSCTTAVACIRTGRRYVCFEVSETYAAAGQARVDKLLAERQARNTKK